MSESEPLATHDFIASDANAALVFLKRIRAELRTIRRVRVWTDRFRVYDVNGDCFEILGVGYQQAEIVPILDGVNTVYKRDSIHEPTDDAYKEFKTGRRYPWAADRVM
ncbi:MAG: hypothetical protein IID45_01830 [Planctomycetes bacterium]|nr:hypothetical protein [Planctomycetota bacterium]